MRPMRPDENRLTRIVAALARLYGRPSPPDTADAFEMILLENVAYLTDDAKRGDALRRLRREVGTRPERVLAAPRGRLLDVTKAGILPEQSAERIRRAAEIAVEDFAGDLDAALDAAPVAAAKALRKFPSIGEPGAEKILLFTRREAVLALDSNGLRALLRLGFGREEKSYAASYRSVRETTRAHWKMDFDWLIAAHQLLRRHGQELCKRTRPLCERCPLTRDCAYFRKNALGA